MLRLWRAFVRLFFRLLYNQFAWTYDWVAWIVSFGQWRAWGRTALPYLTGERVLDVAHGPGHLLVTMAQRGLTAVGLDLSPYMGRLARRRLAEDGELTVPLVRARAQAMPFRDGCFESASATFPAEFILCRATLHETARVLADGGRFVIVAGVRLSERDLVSRAVWWLYRITGQGEPVPAAAQRVLAEAGFTSRVIHEQVGVNQVTLVVCRKACSVDQSGW